MMVLMDDNVDNEHHLMDEKDPIQFFICRILYKQKKPHHTCGFGLSGGKNFDNAAISCSLLYE